MARSESCGLGRFDDAADYATEALRLAQLSGHAFTVSIAYYGAGPLYILKGDWTKARSLIEHWVEIARTWRLTLHLPWAVALSAWALAQAGEATDALNRVQEAERLLEDHTAKGLVADRGWEALGRACLALGRLQEAQRLGERAIETLKSQPGFTARALHLLGDVASHADRFDTEGGKVYYLSFAKTPSGNAGRRVRLGGLAARGTERCGSRKGSRHAGFAPCVRPLRTEAGVEQRPIHRAAASPHNVG